MNDPEENYTGDSFLSKAWDWIRIPCYLARELLGLLWLILYDAKIKEIENSPTLDYTTHFMKLQEYANKIGMPLGEYIDLDTNKIQDFKDDIRSFAQSKIYKHLLPLVVAFITIIFGILQIFK